MEKNIKDYLHLYLGCECEITDSKQNSFTGILTPMDLSDFNAKQIYIKLHLRPLPSMTEEEFYEFKVFADNDASKMVHIKSVKELNTNLFHEFEATKYLLSKQFDIFGLIESGLAIDKTLLNKTTNNTMATSSKKQNDSDVLELEAEVIPLEKVIDNTLVKNNVTEAVISGLKEKYGGLKLKDVEDKESYLEICEARKDVRRYGILAEKICKVGREDAIKIQKLWLSKEKDILGKIAEVQDPLDVEIKKYEDEVKRKETLAIQQREEAYLKRQQQLLKYGATYQDGSFVLNHISYEANTIKDSDEEIFIETIIPKYLKEYEKNEAERVALEKKREEEALALKAAQGEMERQQRELAAQQEAFRKQQQELAQQQEQAQKAQREAEERERVFKTQQEEKIWRGRLELIDEVGWNGQFAFPKLGDHETKIFAYDELVHLPDNVFNARLKEANDSTIAHKKEIEEKRLAEIERQKTEVAQAAATAEREKIEREQAEEKLKAEQESKRKAEELEKATDKVKWQNFIAGINAVQFPETKHPAYKARVAEAKKMIDKINNL